MVPVSSLFEDPDTEGETKTHHGIADAPDLDVVEAEVAKQENNCQFVRARGESHQV